LPRLDRPWHERVTKPRSRQSAASAPPPARRAAQAACPQLARRRNAGRRAPVRALAERFQTQAQRVEVREPGATTAAWRGVSSRGKGSSRSWRFLSSRAAFGSGGRRARASWAVLSIRYSPLAPPPRRRRPLLPDDAQQRQAAARPPSRTADLHSVREVQFGLGVRRQTQLALRAWLEGATTVGRAASCAPARSPQGARTARCTGRRPPLAAEAHLRLGGMDVDVHFACWQGEIDTARGCRPGAAGRGRPPPPETSERFLHPAAV